MGTLLFGRCGADPPSPSALGDDTGEPGPCLVSTGAASLEANAILTDETLQLHVTNDPTFMENGYIVYLRDGGHCWIIDPGLPPQADHMVVFIDEHRLQPDAVLLTHAHADHIAGIDGLLAGVGPLPVYLAKEEWPMLTDPNENLSAALGAPVTASVDDLRDLSVGLGLELESTGWVVGDISGHSPGGRSLYCARQSIVIVGDGLFSGSIGRVDFPHSDGQRFLANLHATLMSLPDDTRVLSGHGPETTIGRERATNPFLQQGL